MRISPCGLRGNDGAKRWIGSSSETSPRSTSCSTAVAAIGLEIEARRNTDSGRTGHVTARGRPRPKPWAQTTDSPDHDRRRQPRRAQRDPGVVGEPRQHRGIAVADDRAAGCADTAADSNSTGASPRTERRGSRRRMCRGG